MRTSSMKSILTALSLFAIITVAVPVANARPAQPRIESRGRATEPGLGDRVARAVRRILNTLTNNSEGEQITPTVPIPGGRT